MDLLWYQLHPMHAIAQEPTQPSTNAAHDAAERVSLPKLLHDDLEAAVSAACLQGASPAPADQRKELAIQTLSCLCLAQVKYAVRALPALNVLRPLSCPGRCAVAVVVQLAVDV
eukprot:3350667-Pleurochrysis_carterae.AAC.2